MPLDRMNRSLAGPLSNKIKVRIEMAKINHDRPCLKYIDGIKREISELDALYKSEQLAVEKAVRPVNKLTVRNEKRPITALDRKIHLVACSILAHVELHREVSLCNKLVTSLKGARKTAAIEWFCATGGLTNLNPKTNKRGSDLFFVKQHKIDRNEAEAKPFWEFLPGVKRRVFNFEEEIKRIITACDKCLVKPVPDPRDNIDLVLLGKLKVLVKSRV